MKLEQMRRLNALEILLFQDDVLLALKLHWFNSVNEVRINKLHVSVKMKYAIEKKAI